MDLVAVAVLALGWGLVLGYLAAVPRVKVLEKALLKAQAAEKELVWAQSKAKALALDLERAREKLVLASSVREKELALRVSELEMALDWARSKAMGKE
jgi:hypothetical protein